MSFNPAQIAFNNRNKPNSGFDLIRLEDLIKRKDLEVPVTELHLVQFYIIIFITDGNGMHTIDFTDYKCKRGTILTIRRGQIQKFHKSNTAKGLMLLFKDEFLLSYLEHLEAQRSLQLFNEQLSNPCIRLAKSDFNDLSDNILNIQSEYVSSHDEYSLGIIRSLLHILITKLYRVKQRKEIVLSSKKYLSEFIVFQNLVERKVVETKKVADYAKMMGVSTKTLNTVSKSIINQSAKDFIDSIAINQIKRLLINTNLTVNEIAYESGFNDSTNFYKYFKRKEGQTPESYRGS